MGYYFFSFFSSLTFTSPSFFSFFFSFFPFFSFSSFYSFFCSFFYSTFFSTFSYSFSSLCFRDNFFLFLCLYDLGSLDDFTTSVSFQSINKLVEQGQCFVEILHSKINFKLKKIFKYHSIKLMELSMLPIHTLFSCISLPYSRVLLFLGLVQEFSCLFVGKLLLVCEFFHLFILLFSILSCRIFEGSICPKIRLPEFFSLTGHFMKLIHEFFVD